MSFMDPEYHFQFKAPPEGENRFGIDKLNKAAGVSPVGFLNRKKKPLSNKMRIKEQMELWLFRINCLDLYL